ncbi:toxin [Pseudomonas sp. NA-150]|uniref:toxin n=1 Tax=Pseudomonas sp. NA-150 TaxID=3367525 RepID=UPI0037C768D6
MLLQTPDAGDVIRDTGGLRKVRFGDVARGKGKRGGLRVIYYWWLGGAQFWLLTLYDKDELDDLSNDQRKTLKNRLEEELKAREKP